MITWRVPNSVSFCVCLERNALISSDMNLFHRKSSGPPGLVRMLNISGVSAANGKNNYNTVRGIREGGLDKERLDRIGMIDHSKGAFDFE